MFQLLNTLISRPIVEQADTGAEPQQPHAWGAATIQRVEAALASSGLRVTIRQFEAGATTATIDAPNEDFDGFNRSIFARMLAGEVAIRFIDLVRGDGHNGAIW